MSDRQEIDRWYVRLALIAAAATFVMIVIGAITRVSESGMGCGTYWPDCNGRIIPDFRSMDTVIEFGHRLFALLVGLAALAVLVRAWRKHREEPLLFYPAALGMVLYIVQSGLGAATVKMSNEWVSVLLHLANSMLLLSCYLIAWVNGRGVETSDGPVRPSLPEILLGAVLAFGVVMVGAAVAGTQATKACVGWPLCMGDVWPASQGPLQMLNMSHRLIAGALGIFLVYLFFRARTGSRGLLYVAIQAALALYVLQAAVGAGVVLINSGGWLLVAQSLHVTFAAATWSVMILASGVVWLQQQSSKTLSKRSSRSAAAPSVTISS